MQQSKQQEIDLLKKLIHSLEAQNNSRNLQRNTLNSHIDNLLIQNAALYKQLESLKRRPPPQPSLTPPPIDPHFQNLLQSQLQQIQILQQEISHLTEQNHRLVLDKSEKQAKSEMERTLLQREMQVLKKLAVQNDSSVKKGEMREGVIREKEERIRELEDQLNIKNDEVELFREDVEELRQKTEVLSEQLEKARLEDTQSQLCKYQKDLLNSRKAYDQLKNSTTIRIDLLQHKLSLVTSQLQKNSQQRSHSLSQRQQLGRNISQLRQVNQSLTIQLQSLNKQYDDLLKLAEEAQQSSISNSSSNPKQAHEIETLRTELSSLIAINFTLSNQLNAARERESTRLRKSDLDSSRGGTERDRERDRDKFTKGESGIRDQSPIYDRSHRHTMGNDDREFKNSRIKERISDRNEQKHFQKQIRKLKNQLHSIKSQSQRVNHQNRQLSQMNQYLVKKNTKIQLYHQPPSKSHTPSNYETELPRQRQTSRDYSIRPSERLSKIVGEEQQVRSSRQSSNKSKLMMLQRKLNELKIDGGDMPRVSPRLRNNL